MVVQTMLDRFAALFENEAELREAVLSLLEKTPNVTNVRHTHGVEERGKDIVFNYPGPLGHQQLAACVVKNEQITGSAESSKGARAVYNQAEQAFDTPIASPATGLDERIAQVFVISPHECTPSTVESKKGKMHSRAGQVIFLCGRELMQRFEKYYPEFLLFKLELYGTYIASLEQGLDANPAVMNVLFQQGFLSGPKKLTDVYVRPTFSRDLRNFQLQIGKLESAFLLSSLNFAESENVQKWFRELGSLLHTITMPEDEGDRIQTECMNLAQAVKSAWSEAFDAHRRRSDISIEERNRPRNELRIKLTGGPHLNDVAKDLLQRADLVVEKFKEKVVSANLCAESKFLTATALLESPLLLEYCQVESVSAKVPWLVTPDSASVERWRFDEEVIYSVAANLLITGPAGFGKTSFCKWHMLYDLKKLGNRESDLIPVYIELYKHAQGELGSFEATFLRAPELVSLWQRRENSQGIVTPRFRLYLDGLDEVPSSERQKELLDLAMAGKDIDPRTSIIVTGRDHVMGSHLSKFARISVREFDEGQIQELAAKWFQGDKQLITEFFSQLEKVPALRPLMSVPLLATLVMGVYKNTRTLPESQSKLYELFVYLLAGGWDVAKNVHRQTGFGPVPKLIVLTKLAGTLHKGRRRDASQRDFQLAIKDTLPGLLDEWQKLLEETTHDGLLVSTGITFAFAHLSFQEYLAAKSLSDPSSGKAAIAFREFLHGDDWWREVLKFYIALSADPKEMERYIVRVADKALASAANDEVKSRAHFLLEMLTGYFPGARPNFQHWTSKSQVGSNRTKLNRKL